MEGDHGFALNASVIYGRVQFAHKGWNQLDILPSENEGRAYKNVL